MKTEIINGKVYFVDELSDYDEYFGNLGKKKSIVKKVGKAVKKTGKAVGKVVKSPIGKVGLVATATYFGAPMVTTKVLPAVGRLGKAVIDKIKTSKTGSWWVKTGKKVFRITKTPSQKTITQEIEPENPLYEELISKLPEQIIPNSEAQKYVEKVKDIPVVLPSGLPKQDVEKISQNLPIEPISEEYEPDKKVEVEKETAEIKTTKPIPSWLPLVAGGGALLLL